MGYKATFFLLVFLLLPLLAQGQQYELMRVGKVDIVPMNLPSTASFNPSSLRSRLHTKVGNLFSQADFDNDLKMLAEEYDRVEPIVEIVQQEIHITLQTWSKPRIRSIEFCGNEKIGTKKLASTFDVEEGSLFDRETLFKGINHLRALYVKKGYFEAEIDYAVLPNETNTDIDLCIKVHEGRAGKIQQIRFYGLSRAEEDELLALLATKRYNFFLSWYTGRGVYHADMIEHDRMQIINYLQNRGYADASVTLTIQEAQETSDKVILDIAIQKGVRYSVSQITLSGNSLFTCEKIWEQCTFGRGSIYSPEEIRNTIQAINQLYGKSGFIDTNIDVQISLHPEAPIYDIAIKIEEGGQYYVGLIKVFGNTHTHTNVILHESLLCPGEVFDNRKLEGTEARLGNTGFFSAVNVYAVRSQVEDPDGIRTYRDVFIEVEETDTGNMGLFCGLSSLDKIFGGVEITERNFNIAGLLRIFDCGPNSLRGGGEFAHAKVNIGDKQTTYLIQWTKPYFLDTPWILGVDLEKSNNRALSQGYTIKTYGGNVHSTYIWNNYLKYDIHYRARHSAVKVSDHNNPLLLEEGNQSGFISAVGASLIYDSTDHPRRASCGFRSRLMGEVAGLGGNFQFLKFSYLNAYYYPLSVKGTLKIRGELQFIKTYGATTPVDLPLSERLFLGGETTVRGYRSFIIGPKFGNNEPRGGVSSLLVSEEYQYNLLPMPCLDAFVFVDAGYVSLSEFTVGRPSASAGFGIRVEIMRNMPLMMGLGWPIHPIALFNGEDLDMSQRFFFAVGGTF